MTATMGCGDIHRGGLDTSIGEWRVATTNLVCAAAAPTVVSVGGRHARGVAAAASGLRSCRTAANSYGG